MVKRGRHKRLDRPRGGKTRYKNPNQTELRLLTPKEEIERKLAAVQARRERRRCAAVQCRSQKPMNRMLHRSAITPRTVWWLNSTGSNAVRRPIRASGRAAMV